MLAFGQIFQEHNWLNSTAIVCLGKFLKMLNACWKVDIFHCFVELSQEPLIRFICGQSCVRYMKGRAGRQNKLSRNTRLHCISYLFSWSL